MRKYLNSKALVGVDGREIAAKPDDPASALWSESVDIATHCIGKQADLLTVGEKFALCVVAGAEIRFKRTDGAAATLETVHACGITAGKEGGFTVTQRPPPQEQKKEGGGCDAPPQTSAPNLNESKP